MCTGESRMFDLAKKLYFVVLGGEFLRSVAQYTCSVADPVKFFFGSGSYLDMFFNVNFQL